MNITIRQLEREDVSRGLVETLAVLAEMSLEEPVRLRDTHRRVFGETHMRTFVAVDDGRVVGTATVMLEQKLIHRSGKVAHIEDVAVQSEYQGKGVGKAMMIKCVEYARLAGCYKVILACTDDNAAFYEKLGFRKHEVSMRLDL